jgi:hypothetical protein
MNHWSKACEILHEARSCIYTYLHIAYEVLFKFRTNMATINKKVIGFWPKNLYYTKKDWVLLPTLCLCF